MPYAMLLLQNDSDTKPLPSEWQQAITQSPPPEGCEVLASNLALLQLPVSLPLLGRLCEALGRYGIEYKTSFFSEKPEFS